MDLKLMDGSSGLSEKLELWMANARIQESGLKNIRKKKNGSVIYKSIAEASKQAPDAFWKEYLYNCSKGNFPKGFSYKFVLDKHMLPDDTKGGIIIIGRGLKKTEYILPDDPPSTAAMCISLLEKHASVFSPRNIRKEDMVTETPGLSFDSWKRAKTIDVKHGMLKEYVFESDKYRRFPTTVKDQLCYDLVYYVQKGMIGCKNIDVRDGRITNINNFEIDSNGKSSCKSHPTSSHHKSKSDPRPKSYRYYENWLRYLDEIQGRSVSSCPSTTCISTCNTDTV